MRECREQQARFTAYLDQELPAADRRRLEEHLASCPACARDWRLFTLTIDRVAALRESRPPADLLAGIRARLDRPPFWARLRALFGRHNDLSLSLPAAAAAVVVAMAAAIFFKGGLLPASGPERDGALSALSRRAVPIIAMSDPRLTAATSHADLALPQPRAAHPPMLEAEEGFRPDIFITVQVEAAGDVSRLQSELARRHLVPYQTTPHVLRLRLAPDDLPALREALEGRQAVVFPPETVIPGYPHHKDLLVVAIRLQ